MIQYVPNILSFLRIALTPIILLLLHSEGFWMAILALVLFFVAGFSDWLDGRVARAYEVKSRLGQFLDPLADKILVLSIFFALPFLQPIIPFWAVIPIIIRDIIVTGLRIQAEKLGYSLPTIYLAKVKTFLQMFFILWILLLRVGIETSQLYDLSNWLLNGMVTQVYLYVVLGITLYTGFVYITNFKTASQA